MSQALHDFAVYGAFATVIAATFFPGSDPSAPAGPGAHPGHP